MKLLVPNALWERLEPLLAPRPSRRFCCPGRKPLDYRKLLTGILFVLKTGIAWDDLPAELGCGCGKTCRHYLRLWHQAGVWRKLHAVLLAELNGADLIDWERALIDASFAKAPEGGEDTGPNPTDRSKSGSKHHVLTDVQGIPLERHGHGGERQRGHPRRARAHRDAARRRQARTTTPEAGASAG
jgi:transposase